MQVHLAYLPGKLSVSGIAAMHGQPARIYVETWTLPNISSLCLKRQAYL